MSAAGAPTAPTAPTRVLAAMTWAEVAATAGRQLLAVPLGATEQHGPHLPLGADTVVADALCRRLADRRDDVVVAPALPFGSSGEHRAFPGTVSIGQSALEQVVVELVRSADAFRAVVLVSGHGGNAAPLQRAAATAAAEGRHLLVWWPTLSAPQQAPRPPDAHAGWVETSLLLALQPEQVHLERAEPGDLRPLHVVSDTLRTEGMAAVTANGVLGDPTGASPALGVALLERAVADLDAAVTRRFGPPPAGDGGGDPGADRRGADDPHDTDPADADPADVDPAGGDGRW